MAEYQRGRGPHFVTVPFELLDDEEADAYTIAVYAALRRFADFGKDTGAQVGDARAAKVAGCGERTFRDRRERLRKMGWVEWEERKGLPNKYVVHASKTPARDADVADTPASDADLPRHEMPTTKSQYREKNLTSSSLRYEDETPERPAFEKDDGTLDAKAFRAVVIPIVRSNVWQSKRPPAVALSRYRNWNEGREANICLQWVKEGTATAEEVVGLLQRFRSLPGIRDGPTSLLWLNDVDGRGTLYELLHEVRKNAAPTDKRAAGPMSLSEILSKVERHAA